MTSVLSNSFPTSSQTEEYPSSQITLPPLKPLTPQPRIQIPSRPARRIGKQIQPGLLFHISRLGVPLVSAKPAITGRRLSPPLRGSGNTLEPESLNFRFSRLMVQLKPTVLCVAVNIDNKIIPCVVDRPNMRLNRSHVLCLQELVQLLCTHLETMTTSLLDVPFHTQVARWVDQIYLAPEATLPSFPAKSVWLLDPLLDNQ